MKTVLIRFNKKEKALIMRQVNFKMRWTEVTINPEIINNKIDYSVDNKVFEFSHN